MHRLEIADDTSTNRKIASECVHASPTWQHRSRGRGKLNPAEKIPKKDSAPAPPASSGLAWSGNLTLQAEIRARPDTDRLDFSFLDPNRQPVDLEIANHAGVPLITAHGRIALQLLIRYASPADAPKPDTRLFGTRLVWVRPDAHGKLVVNDNPGENDSFCEAVEDIVDINTSLKWADQPRQIVVPGSAQFGSGPYVPLDRSITIHLLPRDVPAAPYPRAAIRLPSKVDSTTGRPRESDPKWPDCWKRKPRPAWVRWGATQS